MTTENIDEALATFLANHTNLNQDGIDEKAMLLSILLNYAALHPVPEAEIKEWRDDGYLANVNLQIDHEDSDGTDAAHPAFHRGNDYAMLVLIGKIEEILDGKDTGTGKANEPWESARRRMINLVKTGRQQPVPPKHFLIGPGTIQCGIEGFDAYSKKAVSLAQRLGMALDEDLRKGKQNA